MGARTTVGLLLALALVGGAYMLLRPGPLAGPAGAPSPWPPGFEPRAATSLLFYNQARGIDLELRFERARAAEPWRMTFPRRDEAHQAQLQQILEALQFNPFQLAGKAAEVGAAVLAQMGLADASGAPSGRGFLKIGHGGAEVEVYLGGPDVDERLLFIRIGDTVWRTPVNLWTAFDRNIEDFRSPLVFTLGANQVDRILLERAFGRDGAAGQSLELFRGGLGRWMLREGELETRADETAVEGLLAAAVGLRIQHFAGDLPPDLSGTGLEPPFYRLTLAGQERSERLDIGQADGATVLARRDGRPYLFVLELSGPLPFYLEARGMRAQGDGADLRRLRPLTFPMHAASRLEIRGRDSVRLAVERAADGKAWDLVAPWPVAARDGTVEGLLGALADLKALSAYPAADRTPEETGLDAPAWTWELALDGSPRPLRLQAGLAKAKGVYMAAPGEGTVYFVRKEVLDELVPEPLELVSRLVLRLGAHQFQIVRLVAGEKSLRLDRDMDSGLFRLPGGALAGDAWEELLEGLADLPALKVVSAEAAALERSGKAITVLFYRNPIDPAGREPGNLVESLRMLPGGEGELLAWRPAAPFVYQVPFRLWELAGRLLEAGR